MSSKAAAHRRSTEPEPAPVQERSRRRTAAVAARETPARKGAGAIPPPSSSERERPNRKEVTQARILDAALKLFARRGYDRTSANAIAAKAGVSHAAIFWHFGNKQSLFQAACAHMLRPFIDQLAKSLQQQDPRSRLFGLFAVYEHFVLENREAIETMVRWVLESRTLRTSLERPLLSLHAAFARDVRETLADILDEPELAAPLSAALVSLLDGNLLLSLIDSGSGSQQQRRAGLRELTNLVLDQGARPAGRPAERKRKG